MKTTSISADFIGIALAKANRNNNDQIHLDGQEASDFVHAVERYGETTQRDTMAEMLKRVGANINVSPAAASVLNAKLKALGVHGQFKPIASVDAALLGARAGFASHVFNRVASDGLITGADAKEIIAARTSSGSALPGRDSTKDIDADIKKALYDGTAMTLEVRGELERALNKPVLF